MAKRNATKLAAKCREIEAASGPEAALEFAEAHRLRNTTERLRSEIKDKKAEEARVARYLRQYQERRYGVAPAQSRPKAVTLLVAEQARRLAALRAAKAEGLP